ncbi:DUF192 domain-containing protein [Achromobacter sp. Marseille-Q0513]|nr:DUF192 domain-containing protein [Achromobacter sp. Marseille-Q0513]
MARLRLLRVDGWWGRMRGLAWRKPPGPRSGILLTPCFAVHTFGMRHPIDVAFISRSGRVLELRRALGPRRVALCLGAVAVVELRGGVVDAEHGGVGRIEAAVQHAARRDIERHLQRARELRRQADGHEHAGAQVDEQEHHHPGGAVHQEGPFVAPAGDAGEEQRLRQAQAVPGHQDGRMPEQRGDDHVQHAEDGQGDHQGRQQRRDVLFHRGHAHGLGQRAGERQEGQQADHHAERRIEQAHEEQLAKDAGLLQRLGPHGREHDAVGLHVLARGQRHQRDDGHERHEQDWPYRRDRRRENDQEADGHGPEEHGQGLLAEQAETVPDPLPAGRRGEVCCLHGVVCWMISRK